MCVMLDFSTHLLGHKGVFKHKKSKEIGKIKKNKENKSENISFKKLYFKNLMNRKIFYKNA